MEILLNTNPIEIIDTPKYTIRFFDINYLEYIIKPEVVLDIEDVKETKRLVTGRFPGVKFFVYAEGAEFFTFTRKAREHCATKEHLDNVLVNAFFTTNYSILLIGEVFNHINKPAVTTKIFTSREKAREWITGRMKKSNSVIRLSYDSKTQTS